MTHRYRLPDKIKERQAEELKLRFANSWGGKTERQPARIWLVIALLALLWLAFNLLKKTQALH
jgi:hypothetical protein